ncbi:PH domain-containing protein [Flavobacterium sp.]|uniref:PH domain-containing protein n=1 Tax=Flavobacterium sp. TaxID=239 RepID=UPI003D145FB9
MEKFKSKIDLWFILFLVLIFGAMLVRLVYDQLWMGFAFILLTVVFIVYMFSNTLYTIENEKLFIKCGLFFNVCIEIQKIKRVSESYNIISSPALSFDRLEILYNKFDTILISPKDKMRFIEAIQKRNPEVEIKIKEKSYK